MQKRALSSQVVFVESTQTQIQLMSIGVTKNTKMTDDYRGSRQGVFLFTASCVQCDKNTYFLQESATWNQYNIDDFG